MERGGTKGKRARFLNKEPIDYQEVHSPTEPVIVVVSRASRRTAVLTRRRVVEARLWRALGHHKGGQPWNGQEAAEAIEWGYRLAMDGPTIKAQCWECRDPGRALDAMRAGDSWHYRMFWDWGHQMPKRRLDRQAVMRVLIDGEGTRAVDGALRRRNGWARENLIEGLKLYCDLAGWSN